MPLARNAFPGACASCNGHRMAAPDHATVVASLAEATATLPDESRLRFLERACAGDAALLADVESLIQALAAGPGRDSVATFPTSAAAADSGTTRVRIPDILAGRYRIQRQIGAGGMAVVYLADDELLRRSVALKVQRPDIIRRQGREYFDDEIRLTANLQHPNIVPLFDCGTADGFSFFVMPHITGETLRDHLATRGAMQLRDALRVVTDVLAALQHAHDAGIAHRDVKPSNIMLESDRSMLADFGIAFATDANPAATAERIGAAGTPAYMSPEQATQTVKVGSASDIYSTGCTLYEVLTGLRPTRASSRLSLAGAGFDSWARERDALGSVPPEIRRVIERAVALNPADRFPSADAFARALTEAASAPAEHALNSAQSSAASRAGVARTRSRAVVAISLLIGAIAIAARTAVSVATRAGDDPLPERPAMLDTSRVLVLPYEYDSTTSMRLAGPDRFPLAVARWRGIAIVDAPSIETAAAGVPRSAELVAALAQRLNAGQCIRRTVLKQADHFAIRASLLNSACRQEIVTHTVTVAGSEPPADSVLQKLADDLLLAQVPDSLRTGEWTGTTSRLALMEFARGIRALDTIDLVSADSSLRTASASDTTYARAALWLALVRVWQDAPREAWAPYVTRAQRSASSLSPRDARALPILATMASGDSALACAEWQRDTKEADADLVPWFNAARCMLSDDVVLRDARSTSGWRFRSGLSGAVRTLERALTFKRAIGRSFVTPWSQSLPSLLLLYSGGVRRGHSALADTLGFEAFAAWDERGDSVRLVPYRLGSAPVIPAALRDRSTKHLRELIARVTSTFNRSSTVDYTGVAASITDDATGRRDPIRNARYGWATATQGSIRLLTAIPFVWLLTKHSLPDSLQLMESARFIADSVLRANPRPSPRESAALATLAVLLGRFEQATALVRRSNNPSVRPADFVAELQRFTPKRAAFDPAASSATTRARTGFAARRMRRRLPAIPPTLLLGEADLLLALHDSTPASKLLGAFLDSISAIDLESLRSPIEIAGLMRVISTYARVGPRTEADRKNTARWALALRTLWSEADSTLHPLLDGLANDASTRGPPT